MQEHPVVVVGGGNWFRTQAEYRQYLKNVPSKSFQKLLSSFRDWKAGLRASLGDGYPVVAPTMPCKQNAKYVEWEIAFQKIIGSLETADVLGNTILIGHSLGSAFLARYLDRNALRVPVTATFLVSAPFDATAGFAVRTRLTRFTKQAGRIFLYHSSDDSEVAFAELAKYQGCLPDATLRIFENRGHFLQQRFPELIDDIRAL